MAVVLLFSMVIGLLLIGVPIAVSLGLSSILFLLFFSDATLASVAGTLFEAFEGHFTLLAIPFFILASSFMTTGGVARRIIRFSIACVGHLPGGLAIAGVFACMMFAALSGSSPATVVAIGSIVIAGMRQVGYSKEFAAGVICNAGTLGILIPPSIVMVVYAAAVEVSVGRMFLAGVIPGLMAGMMLMITIYVMAKVKNLPKGDWLGWGEILESGRDAGFGLFLIVIILGGILGGIVTPTEAASIAVAYALFIGIFVYRTLTFKGFYGMLVRTARIMGVIFVIIAFAGILGWWMSFERIPQLIAETVLGLSDNRYAVIAIIIGLLLVVGMVMDITAILIILAPVLVPLTEQVGLEPIHAGIIFVLALNISLMTPPVGACLFVLSSVTGEKLERISIKLMPFLIAEVAILFAFAFWEDAALWLPRMLGYAQ